MSRSVLAREDSEKVASTPIRRRSFAGSLPLGSPILWFGHDFKNPIDVWNRLGSCPGVMVNAYQLMRLRRWRLRTLQRGIRGVLNFEGPIFFDSGGYQFQQRADCSISPDELLDLYRKLEPDVGAVLDLPLRPLDPSHVNSRRWRTTLEHTKAMFAGEGALTLAPVIHALHPSTLTRRCDQVRAIAPDPPFLCVGSLVPMLKQSHIGKRFTGGRFPISPTMRRWKLIAALILGVRKRFPRTVLHAFGVGSLSTMFLLYILGIDSVDSVSWRLKAAFGAIQLPGLGDRFPSGQPRRRRVRRLLSDRCRELLSQCACPVCRDRTLSDRIAALSSSSFVGRATHNAHVCLSEITSLGQAMRAGRQVEFVRRRLHGSPRYLSILEDVVLPALERHRTPNPPPAPEMEPLAIRCPSSRSNR